MRGYFKCRHHHGPIIIAGQSKAIVYEKLDNICMVRGYFKMSQPWPIIMGWPIISNLFMKNWTIYDERLFKCHHHLGQSLWPANQKQLFMKIWTIYGERPFKMSPPPGPIILWPANPKQSFHFTSSCRDNCIWCKFTGPTYFHTIWRMFFIQSRVNRPSPMSPPL